MSAYFVPVGTMRGPIPTTVGHDSRYREAPNGEPGVQFVVRDRDHWRFFIEHHRHEAKASEAAEQCRATILQNLVKGL